MLSLNPKISVIVPVYDTEKYLRRCIDSILAQTFTDFELLLIDDGSKDSSGAICDEYAAKDSRVRVFHKENGGVSSARNVGLDNMRGEWVTFADSDDWVRPQWLQCFMNCDDEYDLVEQGFETDCANKQKNKLYGIAFDGKVEAGLIELFRNNCLGYLWVKRFRASIIRRHALRFDCKLHFQEDEVFLLSYAAHSNKMISKTNYNYVYYYPNANKYKSELNYNWFYITESLLRKSLVLYCAKNDIVLYYVNSYTDALIDLYERKQKGRRGYLKRYRNVAGKLLIESRLYPITRYLIYLDPLYIISYLVLNIHTTFKHVNQ